MPRARAGGGANPETDSSSHDGTCPACSRLPDRSRRSGLAIAYIVQYGPGSHGLKDVTDVVWISELGIHYKLGVSGLNVLLVGLTALLFFAAILASNLRSWERPRLFYFHMMLAESAVLGAFLAQDLALFVAFFDLMLIPFYFLVGTDWGRPPGSTSASTYPGTPCQTA